MQLFFWLLPAMLAAAWAASRVRRQLREEQTAEAARWKALMGPLSEIPAGSWRLRHEWGMLRRGLSPDRDRHFRE